MDAMHDSFPNSRVLGATFYFYLLNTFHMLIYFQSHALVSYMFPFNSSAVDTTHDCFLWIFCHVLHLWATGSEIRPVNYKMFCKWVIQALAKMRTG